MADGKGKFAIIGSVAAGIAGLAAFLVNITQISDWVEAKMGHESSIAEETVQTEAPPAPVQTTESAAVFAEPETTAAQESASGTDAPAQETTSVSTAVTEEAAKPAETEPAAAPPAKDDTVRADSDFKLRMLAEVHPASWHSMPSTFFTYDENKGLLYFLQDTVHIASCDLATGIVQEIGDVGDKAEALGLITEPQSGKLFAAIRRTDNRNYVQIYDCTEDKTVCDNALWLMQTGDSNTLYADRSRIYAFTSRNEYSIYKPGEGMTESGDTGLYQSLQGNSYAAIMPFLYENNYWHAFLACDYDRTRYTLDVAKTTQILPSASCELTRVAEIRGICGISAGADGLCYLDADKNIWQVDPEAERGDSLLSASGNPDTLLVDGSRIENSASGYLSGNVPCFIRIDNSHFVLYDAGEDALKLLYTEEN